MNWETKASSRRRAHAAAGSIRVRLRDATLAVLIVAGAPEAASAPTVADEPACSATLGAAEQADLRACLGRGLACTKYWPNHEEDLQDCQRTAAWIRGARQWPAALRAELFGATPTTVSAATPPSAGAVSEPAWKKLQRRDAAEAPTVAELPKASSRNPYAGTSAKISSEATREEGRYVEALNSAMRVFNTHKQAEIALENPDAAEQAAALMNATGMGDLAATEADIEAGRQEQARVEAERRRREEAQQFAAAQEAARARAQAASLPPSPRSVTTTSERPSSSTPMTQTYVGPEESRRLAEIERQRSLQALGLPVTPAGSGELPRVGSAPVQTTGNSRAGGFVTARPTPPPEPLKPLPPRPAPMAGAVDVAVAAPANRARPRPQLPPESPFAVAALPPVPSRPIDALPPPFPESRPVRRSPAFDSDESSSADDLGLDDAGESDESGYEQAMREHEQRDRERFDAAKREQAEREADIERARSSACRQALAQVDADAGAASARWIGALQSLSGSLWWTNRKIDVTQAQCRGVEPEYSRLDELERAAASARTGCEQLTAGGSACVAQPY